jgi:serine/threonine protein kinase
VLTLATSMEHEVHCFEKELKIIRSLPAHPNLLQCMCLALAVPLSLSLSYSPIVPSTTDLGHSRTDEHMCLFVTRYSCSLRKHIQKLAAAGKRFTVQQVCRIAHQIASGLAALHSHSILHRDIKVCPMLLSLSLSGDTCH